PWRLFIDDIPLISETIVRQNYGDSALGNPLLAGAAFIALASLGPRRGLWLAAPLLWPYPQQIYKVLTVPFLSPLLAMFWAVPMPGATLAGVICEAVLLQVARRRPIPPWLRLGLCPAAQWPAEREPDPDRTAEPAPIQGFSSASAANARR
ncbi:MAG TPA: hypothetical protein VGJ46_10060, partial [Candidatus Limnocylindrales bacterium]